MFSRNWALAPARGAVLSYVKSILGSVHCRQETRKEKVKKDWTQGNEACNRRLSC